MSLSREQCAAALMLAFEHRGDRDLADREACIADSFANFDAGGQIRGVSHAGARAVVDSILPGSSSGKYPIDVTQPLDVVVRKIGEGLSRVPPEKTTVFRGQGGYATLEGAAEPDRVAVELSKVLHFCRATKDGGTVPVHPSRELIARVMSVPHPGIPELYGRRSGPLLRPDGSVRLARGYDAQSRLWCDGWPDSAPVVGSTRDDARAAALRLVQFVEAGQWQGEAGQDSAFWLGHVLTVAGRSAIDGCVPAFMYSASATGSGKTTLARVAGEIGGACSAWTEPSFNDDAELARRLDDYAGKPAVVLDNARGVFRSALLEAAVTGGTLPVRRLYVGPVVTPWRTVLSVTSNGCELGADWLRRSIPVRLRPGRLNAARDVLAEARDNLALRADAITVLRAWLRSGEAYTGTSLASFGEWSRVVAGAIAWVFDGLDIVKESREAVEDLAEADDGDGPLLDLIAAWCTRRGCEDFTSRELWNAATSPAASLEEFGQTISELGSAAKLGRRLARLHDSKRATAYKIRRGTKVWRIANR